MEKTAGQSSPPAKARLGQKQNGAANLRVAHRSRTRSHRVSGNRTETVMCPLRWL
jgi:hypothetical protein